MKKIVIQGIGYVGLAMLTFCAGAKKKIDFCMMWWVLKENLKKVTK